MKNMRKVLCSLLALGTFMMAFAQEDSYIKPAILTVNFTGIDFKTPASLRGNPLSPTYSDFSLKNVWTGLGVSYLKGVSKQIDFVGSVNGAFVYYPFRNESKNVTRTRHLLLDVDAGLNIKMLSDKHPLVPFLNVGVGTFNYDTVAGYHIPVGVGLQYNIQHKVYILLNAQYRLPLTKQANYNFFYSLGVGIPLIRGKKVQPEKIAPKESLTEVVTPSKPVITVKPVVLDTDGDGILDDVDKCPTIPGIAKYQGCPIPDTDGDGVNDEEDRCPTVPGVAKYLGCPIPDTDGDGVNDEMDKCPTVFGPASNNGCPLKVVTAEMAKKVEIAAKEIYFETGKAILLPKSYSKLDEVVAIMKANETIKIEADGHTDNVGLTEKNQLLSEDRAAAVVKYFASKGIAVDRLTSKGFGPSMPIDTNATPAGRAKNRRVELKIRD